MPLPDNDDTPLVEKCMLMKFLLDQQQWVIMALLARCGGDAKVTKDELDFVRKTYDVDENIKNLGNILDNVHMKLKLKV